MYLILTTINIWIYPRKSPSRDIISYIFKANRLLINLGQYTENSDLS
jgi:hypothetical protein